MYNRTGNYLVLASLIGLVLGAVIGITFGKAALPVKVLGDIFLNILEMVVIPVVVCSLIVAIANLNDLHKLGRIGYKVMLYFLATNAIAVAIGMILANIAKPGIELGAVGSVPTASIPYSFLGWLAQLIPARLPLAAIQLNILPIIVFIVFLGSVLVSLGSKGKPVIGIVESLNEALMKMVNIIMWLAPVGIFGLIAGQLAVRSSEGRPSSLVLIFGGFGVVIVLGLLIQGAIVLPAILKSIGGKNPGNYFLGMSSALMTALAGASSTAALPAAMEGVQQKNDIDRRSSALVLPLGTAINRNGTALFVGAVAVIILQATGASLSIWTQILVFVTAVLGSFAVAGVPQGSTVLLALVLQAAGLPPDKIGLGLAAIIAASWFFERLCTALDVWGNAVGAAVIAGTAEIGLVDRSKRKFEPLEKYVPRFSRGGRKPDKFHDRRRDNDVSDKGGGRQASGEPRRFVSKTETAGRREERDRYHRERPERFRRSDRREEYRPADTAPSDKMAGKQIEPAESGKQPFRRGSFGDRPFKKRMPQAEKEEFRPQAEEKPKPVMEHNENIRPDYEIPKFPDRILEELKSGNSKEETGLGRDEAISSGISETSDAAEVSAGETQGDKISQDRGNLSDTSPIVYETSPQETDSPSAANESHDVPDEHVPADIDNDYEPPTESEEESIPDETSDESPDGTDDSVKWGRPKRKKLNR